MRFPNDPPVAVAPSPGIRKTAVGLRVGGQWRNKRRLPKVALTVCLGSRHSTTELGPPMGH